MAVDDAGYRRNPDQVRKAGYEPAGCKPAGFLLRRAGGILPSEADIFFTAEIADGTEEGIGSPGRYDGYGLATGTSVKQPAKRYHIRSSHILQYSN
jgi:hypothetical protein